MFLVDTFFGDAKYAMPGANHHNPPEKAVKSLCTTSNHDQALTGFLKALRHQTTSPQTSQGLFNSCPEVFIPHLDGSAEANHNNIIK
jgi:hypothetical protein